MGYHPRIESEEIASFVTTRSRNSELWFVNNEALETAILSCVAKYSHTRGVELYGLAIEGNHIQAPAHFPFGNRADFMRDLNSSIARAIPRLCPNYDGGRFWGRRYSNEFIPGDADIENSFFYTALQPVQDGLVERLSDYPGYNFFHDAVHGIVRNFEVLDRRAFNAARKLDPSVSKKEFITIHPLRYHRLPGYEDLTQAEYAKLMYEKLEERRIKIVNERKTTGKGFLGPERLRAVVPGSKPKNTKTSKITDNRPRILSICPERRQHYKAWYFDTYFAYKEASRRYRAGELGVEFPKGTYRPHIRAHAPPGS